MKIILRSVVLAGLVMVGSAVGVRGQQAERVVRFEAPFAFEVENNRLAAGEYTVLVQAGWVQIQGEDGEGAAHALTMAAVRRGGKEGAAAHVVFLNDPGCCFFVAVLRS